MQPLLCYDNRIVALTLREREVYRLLLAALSDKEISERMGISWHTVRYHVSNIFLKCGVRTRTQLFLEFVK
jgi:DNA-binding CsgD family transcriptional regulator